MADWVFCTACTSSVTNGDFDNAYWWDASTGTQHVLTNNYSPPLNPNDNVWFVVSVDSGSNNNTAVDISASVGRRPNNATVGSPFSIGANTQCIVGGSPSPLTLPSTDTAPPGTWTGVGPYTVKQDSGNKGNTSKYEFVMVVSLNNSATFGEDPEMDVSNGQ